MVLIRTSIALAVLAARIAGGERTLADMESYYGIPLTQTADFDCGESLLRDALELRRRLFGPSHMPVGESLNGLGVVLGLQGGYEHSETMSREALPVRRRMVRPALCRVGSEPTNPSKGRIAHHFFQTRPNWTDHPTRSFPCRSRRPCGRLCPPGLRRPTSPIQASGTGS